METPPLFYTCHDSPIGRLLLAGDGTALRFLSFPGGRKAFPPEAAWVESAAPFREARSQLAAYFAGELRAFDLPLDLRGTAFQKRVWLALRTIPYGETRSYGWLAERLGAPKASRAVGAANGANPLPIVLPCHRVLGADGSLTGFGGGIGTKRRLLALEAGGAEGRLRLL